MTGFSKPIVFFSHAGEDAAVIGRLQALFRDKTQGTITVFSSSDGQSIPVGRNWVAELEQALDRAKIAFCFLTPSSVDSHWVHFEAGHVHARKIRVIPVGLLGLDLAQVQGPLSLLQGFNVRDRHGLNNLIEEVNREFGFELELSFTDEEYDQVVEVQGGKRVGLRDDIAFEIESLAIDLDAYPVHVSKEAVAQLIREQPGAKVLGPEVVLAGFLIRARRRSIYGEDDKPNIAQWLSNDPKFRDNDANPVKIAAHIDERCPDDSVAVLEGFLASLRRGAPDVKPPSLWVRFGRAVGLLREYHRISTKIDGTPIELTEGALSLGDVTVRVPERYRWEGRGLDGLETRYSSPGAKIMLEMSIESERIDLEGLFRLVEQLFECEVLRFR